MKYKISWLAGGFVLFCIEIKLLAKVEGGFPRLWPSKFFRCEFRKWLKTASAGGAHLKLCPMQISRNLTHQEEPTGSIFFIQKTSRLAVGFNFIRIDLKLMVKVGTIFLRLGVIIFSFKWDFWRRRKCPRRLLHEGGLSGPKQIRQKYLTGFGYLTRLLVETKKLLT